jgi:hypothetical protein
MTNTWNVDNYKFILKTSDDSIVVETVEKTTKQSWMASTIVEGLFKDVLVTLIELIQYSQQDF